MMCSTVSVVIDKSAGAGLHRLLKLCDSVSRTPAARSCPSSRDRKLKVKRTRNWALRCIQKGRSEMNWTASSLPLCSPWNATKLNWDFSSVHSCRSLVTILPAPPLAQLSSSVTTTTTATATATTTCEVFVVEQWAVLCHVETLPSPAEWRSGQPRMGTAGHDTSHTWAAHGASYDHSTLQCAEPAPQAGWDFP